MSNPESFIREVAEEVRRDRLHRFMRRYAWIGVLLIVGVVGGTALVEWQAAREQREAERLGDAIISALGIVESGERAAALAAIETEPGDVGAILAMLIADAEIEAGRRGEARRALEQVSAVGDPGNPYYQLARLKLLLLDASDGESETVLRGADALSAPGEPYRPLALEIKALALLDLGRVEEAAELLAALIADEQSRKLSESHL